MSETFTIKELADYLRCSVSELRKLIKNGEIPFYRVGKKIFFKHTSIEEWILQQENINTNKKLEEV